MVYTPSTEDTTLKTIGASFSQNNSDISIRKDFEKEGASNPVNDNGDNF